MKKLFILFLLLCPSVVFAKNLRVNGDANVRNSPSKDGTIITVLTEGTHVEGKKSSSDSNWYEITVDGKKGYIHKSLLDTVVSISALKDDIVPFKSGLFWWIVIDKLILIGVFIGLFSTGNPGKAFLWLLVCLASTLLIAFILTKMGEELFITMFGFTALLCLGVSPIALFLLICILIGIWLAITQDDEPEKVLIPFTFWIEV